MLRLVTIFLLCVAASAFAESKVLHVSTIPSNADIYVDQISPDHAKNPAYVSPAFIEMADDSLASEVLISLFNPGFMDTTLRVRLSPKDTSYIIISQMPIPDEDFLEKQQSELSKRKRANFGKGVMKFSIIPFAIGLVSGAIAYYEIEKAKDSKKTLKNSAIHTDHYQQDLDDFKDYRDKAKVAKGISYGGIITGAALFSIGFILSF
jgi:hypothetical protein